jgi:aspartate/methionine/tyrosine aminotransferase
MAHPPASPIPPFRLERYFDRYEFSTPYLLSASDVEGWALADLLALADTETRRLWETLTLGYTETAGHPRLREAIAALYTQATAQDILCTASAEEAIYLCMRTLLRPGDHLVAVTPGYQSSYQIAEAMGVQVTRLPLRLVESTTPPHWVLDLDALATALTPATRLLAVNFPHNPTGCRLSPAAWQTVIDLARRTHAYLLSDELYRLMEYDPAHRLPAAVDLYERGISLGALSKAFGLAGLRVGWLACREPMLRQAAQIYKDYTTICASAPSEILGIIALRAADQVVARSMAIIHANRAAVEQFMAEHPAHFTWIPPQAGSVAFPRWRGRLPVAQMAERLVQTQGVMLLPGEVFAWPGEHFRLGLGRPSLPAGLARLAEFLR